MSLKIVVLAKQVPDTRNVGPDAMGDPVQIDLTMRSICLSGRDLVSHVDRSIDRENAGSDVACLDSEYFAGTKSRDASEAEYIYIPVIGRRTIEQPPDVRRLKNDLFFLRS